MKGMLIKFENQVNNVMQTTYKSYKDDFKMTIGYAPVEPNISKKNNILYNNKLSSQIEQEISLK